MNPGFEIPKAYTTRKTFFMEKYFLILNLQILWKHMIMGFLRTIEEAELSEGPWRLPH